MDVIVDDFPFLAETNPSIKSILQHKIDHDWKERNLFLILCGSSVSFMLNDIMGYKSPLYGRSTGSMEVQPFDYLESAAFFPNYSEEDKLIAYGILGGVPRYLNAFDPGKSLRENLISEILTEGTFLNDEPQALLRMELREPAVYNSILEAVANGCNRVVEIADRIHEEKSKCSKYMLTLQTLRLLEKHVPCGEPNGSKKGIYEITGHMGPVFEDICRQYLIRRAKAGKLPFVPCIIGKWWGNNPVIRAQDDVDLLALDRNGERGIFVECKFRNKPMAMEEYNDLATATEAFPNIREKNLIFISKSGFSETVRTRAEEEGAELVEVREMFG